jgi:hypothetical protein
MEGSKNKMYCQPTFFFCLRMLICVAYLNVFCILQQYRSMSKRNPFVRDVFIDPCPKGTRLCVMCLPVRIDSNAAATVRYR